jgi:hypothetical protein
MKESLYWYFRQIKFDIVYMFEELFDWNWNKFEGVPRYFKDLVSKTFYPLRCIKYGLENFYNWFKLIWFDRDWDYYFLQQIIKFKIKRMIKHITKYNSHTEWKRDVKSMQFVVDCLERIEKDDYRKKLLDRHEEIYGELTTKSTPHTFDKNGKPLLYSMDFGYKKSDTEVMKQMARDDWFKIHNMAKNDKQRDYRLFGKALGKYIQHWWD